MCTVYSYLELSRVCNACHLHATEQIDSIMSFTWFATHVFAVLNAKFCYRWIISWDILFQSESQDKKPLDLLYNLP